MTWISEISNVCGDEELARIVLERNGYAVYADPDDAKLWLLEHSKYDEFSSASEVHMDTISAVSRMTQMAELEGIEPAAYPGTVRQIRPDGSIKKNIFASLSASARLKGHAEAIAAYEPGISERERERRAQDADKREAARKRSAILSRVSAAISDPAVIQITILVRSPTLTMTEAGHIVDIVQDAMRGDLPL